MLFLNENADPGTKGRPSCALEYLERAERSIEWEECVLSWEQEPMVGDVSIISSLLQICRSVTIFDHIVDVFERIDTISM